MRSQQQQYQQQPQQPQQYPMQQQHQQHHCQQQQQHEYQQQQQQQYPQNHQNQYQSQLQQQQQQQQQQFQQHHEHHEQQHQEQQQIQNHQYQSQSQQQLQQQQQFQQQHQQNQHQHQIQHYANASALAASPSPTSSSSHSTFSPTSNGIDRNIGAPGNHSMQTQHSQTTNETVMFPTQTQCQTQQTYTESTPPRPPAPGGPGPIYSLMPQSANLLDDTLNSNITPNTQSFNLNQPQTLTPSTQQQPTEHIYSFMPEAQPLLQVNSPASGTNTTPTTSSSHPSHQVELNVYPKFQTHSPHTPLTPHTPASPIITQTTLKIIEPKDIEVGEFIGEGSFGPVRRGVWRNMDVALKILRLNAVGGSPLSAHSPSSSSKGCPGECGVVNGNGSGNGIGCGEHLVLNQEYLKEVQTMALVCNHANVIQLVGIVNEVSPFSPCIVTEYYANGSVYDKIFSSSELPPDQSLLMDHDQSYYSISQLVQWAIETAQGVHHLHQEHVIHRDLAARNLLLDDSFHIRVCDFGFSRTKEAGASKGFTKSELGPVKWTAPEAMRHKQFSVQSDIFSFGVVLYELFAQLPPWANYDTVEVVLQVCSGERMLIPDSVPPYFRELMGYCWAQDPTARPSFPEIIRALKKYDLLSPDSSPSVHFSSQHVVATPSPAQKGQSNLKGFSPQPFPIPVSSSITGGTGNGEVCGSNVFVDCDVSPLLAASIHNDDINFYRQLHHTLDTNPDALLKMLSSHEPFLRLIYILLQSHGRSSESVDEILRTMKDFQQSDYHLTLTYFWIQLVTYHIALRNGEQNGQESCDLLSTSPSNACESFAHFFKTCKQGDCSGECKDANLLTDVNDADLSDRYYSNRLMDKSKYVFNLPDLQALPSVVPK